MVNAAGAADCAQSDGTLCSSKNIPATLKLLSVNPGMETGSTDFINGRLISSIRELNYQIVAKLQQGWSARQSFMDETV